MTEPGTARCDPPRRLLVLTWCGPADLTSVDALARLRLVGKRVGLDLRFAAASPGLRELLTLSGLDGLLLEGGSGVELLGEAEPREEPGVEEVVEVADPPA